MHLACMHVWCHVHMVLRGAHRLVIQFRFVIVYADVYEYVCERMSGNACMNMCMGRCIRDFTRSVHLLESTLKKVVNTQI